MKEWEQYEDQIFGKLKSEFKSSAILKNQKIRGIFSKRSRQIDILVNAKAIGKTLKIVVDCKKFSKKVTLKTVESFIGFLEDVGAHMGILITNIGFSKSAKRRVENYTRDIRLEIVEFMYLDEYEFHWDYCDSCFNNNSIFSGISWSEPELLTHENEFKLVEIGQCEYCSEHYLRCQDCGEIISENEVHYMECGCGLKFILESKDISDDPNQYVIEIARSKTDNDIFFDPDQKDLFDN